ncbi:MAG: type II secretion system inner membrane protein GspF [Gammaproteobacteria bacterium]|nr:type II secretion system inner membrane protein GspF [Gammaproteobacteria bacterium]MCY4339012.1 type II secretion system inner membrane protein GspF [Gammaproteobacteria bacterium]
MAAFEYTALDESGRNRHGVLSGDSARQLRARLRAMNLYPVAVRAVREDGTKTAGQLRVPRVSAAALALLTRRLATLVRAGMPLDEALRALIDQAPSRRLRAMLADVCARISEGAALHEAMSVYPTVFPEFYCNMVAAGEVGGGLDETLERLADYTESRRALRQSLSTALIYPALLTLVSLLVVAVLLIYVVPEVVRVFQDTGRALPWLTAGLIVTSQTVRDIGWLLGAGAVVALLSARALLKQPVIQAHCHRLLLNLPFIGRVNRTLHAARLTRSLAILTYSGVPLLEALEISSRMITNIPLRAAVQDAAVSVREGGRLHRALRACGWFPPLLVQMLAAGEESGELDDMLARAADYEEQELRTTLTTATALFEPCIILVMGAVVLVIVLAILLPIFEMNQLVGI